MWIFTYIKKTRKVFNGNRGLVGQNKYFLFLEMVFKNMKVNIINTLNHNPKLHTCYVRSYNFNFKTFHSL